MQFDDSDVLVSDMVDRMLDGGIIVDATLREGIDLSDHKSFLVIADLEISLPIVRSWDGR